MGFIFSYGVLMFGWKQFTVPRLQTRAIFIQMCLGIAAMAGMATYYLHVQGMDNAVGGRSAYLIQLSISFLYVPLMLRQPTLESFSFMRTGCVPWDQRWSWSSSTCTTPRIAS